MILALVAVANAVELNTYKYMNYISEFNKSPSSLEEFNMRMRNFISSDDFIQEWNADSTNTHRVGHNFLSDWTAEEKAKLTQLGKGTSFENPRKDVQVHQIDENQAIPTSWNWTAQGVVPNVGNQASFEQSQKCATLRRGYGKGSPRNRPQRHLNWRLRRKLLLRTTTHFLLKCLR